MTAPKPTQESFRNPLFRIAVLVCLLTAVALTLKDGCSPTGAIRIYTENNPIPPDNQGREVVQLLLYLLTFGITMALAVYHKKRRWFFVVYALYFFVFAMEESDWLQQILHYPTPEFFVAHSTKDVVNIHNLQIGGGRVVGVLISRFLLGAPALLFFIVSIRRSAKGEFLGKLPLVAIGLSLLFDCFPRHAVFQLMFGVFALTYPLIVVSVDWEREDRAAEPEQAVTGDATPKAASPPGTV